MAKKILLLKTSSGVKGKTYYFSSAKYISLPSDTLANNVFDSRIINDPTYSRQAGLRVWGSNKSSVAIGYFDIANPDGKYDEIITNGYYGGDWVAEASVLLPLANKSHNFRTVVATCRVTNAEVVSETTIRLTLSPTFDLDKSISQVLYPNTQNVVQLRGRPKPCAIGNPLFSGPVMNNSALQLFDVHFNEFFDTKNIQSAYSRGVLATIGTDWRIALEVNTNGIEWLVSTVAGDPFTIDLGGATQTTGIPGQLITLGNGGSFTTWAGSPSTPSGWTTVGTPSAGVREFLNNSSTCRVHSTSSGTFLQLRKSALTIPSGATLQLRFDITNVSVAGPIDFRILNSAGTVEIDRYTVNANATGHVSVTLRPGANVGTLFDIRLGTAPVDASIDNLLVDVVTTTTAVEDAASFICAQGNITGANFDATSWATLESDYPFTLFTAAVGMYIDTSTQCSQALDMLADSFNGWWWIDRLGVCKAKALYDPAASAASPIALNASAIVAGQSIDIQTDLAPGLATQWGFNRNWRPLGDSDFAGSVTQANREKWSADYQLTGANGTGTLHSLYQAAVGAPVWPTVICNMSTAQQAVMSNYVVGIYDQVRTFKKVPMVVSDDVAITLEPGDLVTLDLGRWNIDVDKHMVAGVDGTFLSDVVNVRLWS